jgi:cysteine desulfurase/selenocysteine lyase
MKNLRKEFPFFTHNPKTIYFDSGATSLKPKVVGEAEKEYLEKVGANPSETQAFINAQSAQEIIFTSGATYSLNFVANGLKPFLFPGDEIWLTSIEHSSNLLP